MKAPVMDQQQRWRDRLVTAAIIGGVMANIVWIGAGLYVLALGISIIIGWLR